MQNLAEMLQCIDQYYEYLHIRKQKFTSDGFPIISPECYLNTVPKFIVPFYHRNDKHITAPKKTVIAFFDKDRNIYPRFDKIFNDIPEYKKFMGVASPDITLTEDMDPEWQNMIALANQLFIAILAINGIKIILNTRSGINFQYIFAHIPHNLMCISSTLGCSKKQPAYDFSYLKKILYLSPSILLIYGTHNLTSDANLSRMGIQYKYYPDFHTYSKEVR